MKVKKMFIYSTIFLLYTGSIHYCSYEQGYDCGYNQSRIEINSALKEQIDAGMNFYIQNINYKFYPRKDKGLGYSK